MYELRNRKLRLSGYIIAACSVQLELLSCVIRSSVNDEQVLSTLSVQ